MTLAEQDSARFSVMAWIHDGDIVTKILFALVASMGLNGILFYGSGVARFPETLLPYLPAAVAVLLSVVIAPEAYANGFGQAPNFWSSLYRRLTALLVVGLIMRGVGVGIAAHYLGFDNHTALLIATGLTATDPAAIAIALALAGKSGNPIRLQELFWLFAIESLVNDGIDSIAFEVAHGESFDLAAKALGLTIFFGIALAFTDEGARWYIREESRWADTDKEAGAEIIAVLLFYFGFALTATLTSAFPIGTVVLGAVIADYLFIHRLPGDRFTNRLEQKRQHYAHLWADWGLAIFLLIAGMLMPYEELIAHPRYLFYGLVVLLAGIVLSRLVYDTFYLILSSESTTPELSGMSVLLAGTLVGVPTFVATSLFEDELHDASLVVFAAILLSWFLVPPAVWYITRLRGSLAAQE